MFWGVLDFFWPIGLVRVKCTNTNTQIRKYTNTQIHKYTNTQLRKRRYTYTHRTKVCQDLAGNAVKSETDTLVISILVGNADNMEIWDLILVLNQDTCSRTKRPVFCA